MGACTLHRVHVLDDESDDDLMARARGGAHAAFAVLVKRHERRVLGYLKRSLDDGEEARDVAQDVFVEVWRRREQYQPQGKFVGWLFRIARSRATSRGRFRAVRRLFAARARPEEEGGARPDDVLERRHQDAAVRAALQGLPASLRDAVALRHGAGLDYSDIAGILGIDEAAARQRACRGLALLGKTLRAGGGP